MVGLAIGGPLVALWGAALLTFSCTANNEAGDAARSDRIHQQFGRGRAGVE